MHFIYKYSTSFYMSLFFIMFHLSYIFGIPCPQFAHHSFNNLFVCLVSSSVTFALAFFLLSDILSSLIGRFLAIFSGQGDWSICFKASITDLHLSSRADAHFFIFASEDFPAFLSQLHAGLSFWLAVNISDKNTVFIFISFTPGIIALCVVNTPEMLINEWMREQTVCI